MKKIWIYLKAGDVNVVLFKLWQSGSLKVSRATVLTCPCVSALKRSWNVVMTQHVYPVMLHWGAEWQDHYVLRCSSLRLYFCMSNEEDGEMRKLELEQKTEFFCSKSSSLPKFILAPFQMTISTTVTDAGTEVFALHLNKNHHKLWFVLRSTDCASHTCRYNKSTHTCCEKNKYFILNRFGHHILPVFS